MIIKNDNTKHMTAHENYLQFVALLYCSQPEETLSGFV